jgi:hypothetical protein
MSPEARFWRFVRKDESCWIWTGALHTQGYGRFKYLGALWFAHRFSYLLANGPIPESALVLHSCDVPACVNPAHLRIGTDLDNAMDRESRGRGNHGLTKAAGVSGRA